MLPAHPLQLFWNAPLQQTLMALAPDSKSPRHSILAYQIISPTHAQTSLIACVRVRHSMTATHSPCYCRYGTSIIRERRVWLISTMQTSSGFFDASKSTLRITQTLDATCGVNAAQCKPILDSFAVELLSEMACKADYDTDNPLVLQAYNGLVAYQPSYQASCLHDDEGNYCFANAVSNMSSPGDAYPYYLPIGQELPGGSRPTCNSCLQQAMGVFATYSNNATQPLSKTYTSAAQQISIACGSTFVNVTAAPLKGAASTTTTTTITPTISLILMFLLYFFQ